MVEHDVPLACRAARGQLQVAMVRQRPKHRAGRQTLPGTGRDNSHKLAAHRVRLRPRLRFDTDCDARVGRGGPVPALFDRVASGGQIASTTQRFSRAS